MDKINFLMEKTNMLTSELSSIMQNIPKITKENKTKIEKLKIEINNNLINLKTEYDNKLEGLQSTANELINNLQTKHNEDTTILTNNLSNIQNEIYKPNLLINGNFLVNQRGKKNYSGTDIYTVDRWRLHSKGSLSVNENNTITYTISNLNWCGLNYFIDNASYLSNKTFTVSLKGTSTAGIWLTIYHNGTIIGQVLTTSSGEFYLFKTFSFGEILDSDKFIIRITTRNTNKPEGVDNNNFTLEYVKLETGSYATPLIPKNYAEELALCQRYYQLKSSNYSFADSELDRTPVMRTTKELGTTTIDGQTYNFADSEIY